MRWDLDDERVNTVIAVCRLPGVDSPCGDVDGPGLIAEEVGARLDGEVFTAIVEHGGSEASVTWIVASASDRPAGDIGVGPADLSGKRRPSRQRQNATPVTEMATTVNDAASAVTNLG